MCKPPSSALQCEVRLLDLMKNEALPSVPPTRTDMRMDAAFITEQNDIQKGMKAGNLLFRGFRIQVAHMNELIMKERP